MDEPQLWQIGEGAKTKHCFGCAEKKPAREISFARRCSAHSNLFVRLPALAFSSRRLSIHPKLWKFGAELAYYV
jgi:hypothetical protein